MAQTVALHHQARRAVRWLAARGITVTAVKAAPRRPYIEIDRPCPRLAGAALEMVQNVGGLRRRVWAARLGGCVVTWNDQPQGEQA